MSAINDIYQNRANISQQWDGGERAAVVEKVTAVVLELAAITAVGFAIAGLLSAGPLACLGNYGYAVIAGGVALEISIWIILNKEGLKPAELPGNNEPKLSFQQSVPNHSTEIPSFEEIESRLSNKEYILTKQDGINCLFYKTTDGEFKSLQGRQACKQKKRLIDRGYSENNIFADKSTHSNDGIQSYQSIEEQFEASGSKRY